MWSICSRPPFLLGWFLAFGACSTQPLPEHPRPPLPLPGKLADRYALPNSIREELLAPIGRQEGIDFYRGRLGSDSERVEFHFLYPESTTPAPLMLMLPILAGGENLMWIVGWNLARMGYAVAWTRRVAPAMRTGQRAPEIEELFRRTVVQNRMVLEWARDEKMIDNARIGLLGISLGGIVGGVLLALEPELAGGALCLAGGNLPDLIMNSDESRIIKWRRWRFLEDGIRSSELRRELETHLISDPARLGPYVATDRVFLISALLDEVVPLPNQDLLWESLGQPRRLSLPLGHYTAVLGIGSLLGEVDEFMKGRFELSVASPPKQPPQEFP